MSKRLMLAALSALSVVTACSGGGIVQPGNDLNPTPAPTGIVATATPTAIGATASPTPSPAPTTATSATPTPGATTAATATPTPGATTAATATPTPGATTAATATPTPTPTGMAAACTTSSAAQMSMTYTLTGSQQTIVLPSYNVFSGSSSIPYNNAAGGTVTVAVSQNNFHNAPTSTNTYPNYAGRTKDFYSTITLGQTTTFYNDAAKSNTTNVPVNVTLTSACITAGTKYYVDLFALGSAQDENSATATPTSTAGVGTVTGPFHVTVNPFTGGLTADVILSH